MKSKILLLLLLVAPALGIAQNFELRNPNVVELHVAMEKSNYTQEPTYLYLIRNYKVISEKTDLRKYNYADYNICAFTQTFEHGIVYSEEQCGETGGITTRLTLPKTERKSLIQWVELIYESLPMDIEHGWNSNKTKFGPTDDGAGCYFEITETEEHTEIDMYCGC